MEASKQISPSAPSVERRTPQVTEVSANALGAMDNLSERLASLEDKLVPVIRSPEPSALAENPSIPAEALVPVADTFRRIEIEARSATRRISDIIERLEI